MKKLKLLTLLGLCLCFLMGCNMIDKSLSAGDVDKNTILIKGDGQIQTAAVEDFDKDYYDEEALTTFINTTIDSYNQESGEETIQLDSMSVKDKVASIVLTYKDMNTYASFNEVDAKFMTVKEAQSQGLLPATFYNAKGSEEVDISEVLEKANYNVVILNEEYDVVVDGKIKYYSGALPLNSKTVQTTGKEVSVIVFKP